MANDSTNILRLGFVRDSFPFIAGCSLRGQLLRPCQYPGIMSDCWLQFANYYGYKLELVHYNYYGSFNDTSQYYYGLIYGLVHSEIDATLSLITPSIERMQATTLGPIVTIYKTDFIYGVHNLDQMLDITVFDHWTIVAIVTTLLLIFTLFYFKYGSSVDNALTKTHLFLTLYSSPRNPILLLGYYQLYLLYIGAFRSQTISNPIATVPFKEIEELHSKIQDNEVKIVLDNLNMVSSVRRFYRDKEMYAAHPPVVYESYADIASVLCRDKKFVYYGNAAPLSGIWYVKPPCPLHTINFRHNETDPSTLSIAIRKTLPRKTKERILDYFETIFNVDAFEHHWAKMYRSYYNSDTQSLTFAPLSLSAMINMVKLYFVGTGVAIALFFLEAGFGESSSHGWVMDWGGCVGRKQKGLNGKLHIWMTFNVAMYEMVKVGACPQGK
uniref:PBPe domain-containing protein n=1 Tax=Panagrellus redivivus TaxID=6233 RepID=A0A7E4VFM5_PANRE